MAAAADESDESTPNSLEIELARAMDGAGGTAARAIEVVLAMGGGGGGGGGGGARTAAGSDGSGAADRGGGSIDITELVFFANLDSVGGGGGGCGYGGATRNGPVPVVRFGSVF